MNLTYSRVEQSSSPLLISRRNLWVLEKRKKDPNLSGYSVFHLSCPVPFLCYPSSHNFSLPASVALLYLLPEHRESKTLQIGRKKTQKPKRQQQQKNQNQQQQQNPKTNNNQNKTPRNSNNNKKDTFWYSPKSHKLLAS